MIVVMARATGWSEAYIKRMPLKILLQYVHAWLVQEGQATRWVHDDAVKTESARRRLADIINNDNDFLASYGD